MSMSTGYFPIFFTRSRVLYKNVTAHVPLDSLLNFGWSRAKMRNFYAVLGYIAGESDVLSSCLEFGIVVWVRTIECHIEANEEMMSAEMKGLYRCQILQLNICKVFVRIITDEKGNMLKLFPKDYDEINQCISELLTKSRDYSLAVMENLASLSASRFCDWCFETLPLDHATALDCSQIEHLPQRVKRVVQLLKEFVMQMKTESQEQDGNSSSTAKPKICINQFQKKFGNAGIKSNLANVKSDKLGKMWKLPVAANQETKGTFPYHKNLKKREDLRRRLEKLVLPEEIREQLMHDLEALEIMVPSSTDYYNLQNYLDFVADLPWNVLTVDRTDFEKSKNELEESHEGMLKVKRRILEYLAVKRLQGSTLKGPTLCFVGPPGVGKTSMAKAVAKAVGRKFIRIALGGVKDESEIRGHRRTYIAALPGRIMQGMRFAKSRNPVILLDEIDKIGPRSINHGDPAAALLEVLDSEQNYAFHDRYLNFPFDLSQVMFIATANTVKSILPALYDRLEIVKMDGYSAEEKVAIACKYIIPQQFEIHGITSEQCKLEIPVVRKLVGEYTREAGVRQLERCIAAICRHVALKLVGGKQDPKLFSITIDENSLELILWDQRVHQRDIERRRQNNRPGTSFGLAVTSHGGVIQIIEVSSSKGKGKIKMTGNLGSVLKESVDVVVTWIKSSCDRYGIPLRALDESDLHVHIPTGAVPKDGPSAGSSLLLAIFSLLTGRLVRTDTAITGEMTLTGDILPVGGIKQKVLAAHRGSVFRVVLPAGNKRDIKELPDDVKKAMEIVFVKSADELINEAMEDNVNLTSKL